MATQSRRLRAARTSFYGACLVVLFSAFECGRVAGPVGDLNSNVQEGQNGGQNGGNNASTTSGANASTTAGTNNNGQSNSSNNSGQNTSFIQMSGVSPITAGAGPVSGYLIRLMTNNANVAMTHDVSLLLTYPATLIVSAVGSHQATTSLTVPSGTNVVNFVVTAPDTGATTAQSAQISVSDPSGIYGSASMPILINPAGSGSNGGQSPTSISLGAPGSAVAGSCVALTVTPKVGANNVPFPSNTYVTFFADKHGEFFTDSQCQSSMNNNTAPIGAGVNSLTVYYQDVVAELDKVTAVAAGLPDHASINVVAGPGDEVVIKGGQTSFSVGPPTCVPFTAVITDDYDNPAPVSQTTTVQLSGIQSFYSDAICSATIDSVTLPPGNSAGAFYVASGTPGDYYLTPSVTGISVAKPMQVHVTPGSANKLVLNADPPDPSGHSTVFAGNCVNLKVTLQDMYLNPTTSAANLAINIGSLGHGSMYAGKGCSGNAIVSTNIPSGSGEVSISFSDTKAENVTPSVSTNSPAINSASYPIRVVATVASGFNVIVPNSGNATAGQCSGAVVLNFVDQYGNPTRLSSVTALHLSQTSHATLYSDWQCQHALPADTSLSHTVDLGANTGDSSAAFYLEDNTAEPVPVDISASGFADASALINVGPGPASRLAIAAPATTVAGLCSAQATVTAEDNFGNPAIIPGVNSVLVTFTLAQIGGSASAQAYSDPNCATPVTQGVPVQIPAQTSSTHFYFMGSTAGTYTITPSTTSSGYGIPLTQNITLLPGDAVGLSWSGPSTGRAAGPASGVAGGGAQGSGSAGAQGSASAGACSSATPFTITRRDGHNNPAPGANSLDVMILPTNNGIDGAFYADASCTLSLPSVSFAGGTYQKVTIAAGSATSPGFYFAGNRPGALTMTAAASGYVNGTMPFTLTAGLPAQLAVSGNHTVAPGQCDGATLITVYAKDIYGNSTTFEDAAHTLNLAVTNSSQGVLLTSCAVTSASTSLAVNIPIHTGAGSFSFRAYAAGNYAIAANIAGTSLSLAFNEPVVASRPNVIVISPASSTTSINVCNNYTMTVYDAYSNPVYLPYAYGIYVYNTGGRQSVYAQPGCAGGAGGANWVQMNANSAQTTFSMLDPYNEDTSEAAYFTWNGVNIWGSTWVRVTKPCNLTPIFAWMSPWAVAGAWMVGTWYVDNSQQFWNYTNGTWVDWGAVYSGCDAWGNDTGFIGWARENGCFSPETRITMAGGVRKRADEVRAGEEIWNPVRQKPMKVKRIFVGPEKVAMYEVGYGIERVVVTSKHPIVTDRGVKMASQIRAGDLLLGQDKRFHAVAYARALPVRKDQKVYNFDTGTDSLLPEDHMLISDGIVTGDWDLQNLLERGYVPKQ